MNSMHQVVLDRCTGAFDNTIQN